jgi:hypothetical protein
MSDVHGSGRVGEHGEAVIFLFVDGGVDLEHLVVGPELLPLGLNLIKRVFFFHRQASAVTGSRSSKGARIYAKAARIQW